MQRLMTEAESLRQNDSALIILPGACVFASSHCHSPSCSQAARIFGTCVVAKRLGVRQSSAAFESGVWFESGRGLPHSKTLRAIGCGFAAPSLRIEIWLPAYALLFLALLTTLLTGCSTPGP